MEFSYIKAYFNSSSDAANAAYKSRCKDPQNPDAICKVPDQTTPPDPRSNTVFLSPNKGLPGGDTAPPTTNPPPVQPPAPPGAPQKKVSPDNSCGGTNGYTCLGSENGNCCSSYGFWYVRWIAVEVLDKLTPDTADPIPLTAKIPNVSPSLGHVVLRCEY